MRGKRNKCKEIDLTRGGSCITDPLEDIRNLFVELIKKALADVRRDPAGKKPNGDSAYRWFWSESFSLYGNLCLWNTTDFRFRELRRQVLEMRERGTNGI